MEAVPPEAPADAEGGAEAHEDILRSRPVQVSRQFCLGGGWLHEPHWIEQTPGDLSNGTYVTLTCESTTLRHFLGVRGTGRYDPLSSFLADMRTAINAQREHEKAQARIATDKRIRLNKLTRCAILSLPTSMTVVMPASAMRGAGEWKFRAILPAHTQHAPTMEATPANFHKFFVAAGGLLACAAEQQHGVEMRDGRRGKEKRHSLGDTRKVRLLKLRTSSGHARFRCRVPVDGPAKKRKKSVMGLSPLNPRRERERQRRLDIYAPTRDSLQAHSATTILEMLGAKKARIQHKRAAVKAARKALRDEYERDAFADEEDSGDASDSCPDCSSKAPCTPIGAPTSSVSGRSPAAWSNDSPGGV